MTENSATIRTCRSPCAVGEATTPGKSVSRFDAVREIVAATFGIAPAQITSLTAQDDVVEWDSVGHLNLMLALEQALDLRLDVEQMAQLTGVPAILRFLEATSPST